MLTRLLVLAVLALVLAACSQKIEPTSDTAARSAKAVRVIEKGFVPRAGDQVWIRVFDEKGEELVFEKIDVDAANLSSWRGDLGRLLNGGKASRYLRANLEPDTLTRAGFLETEQVWLKNPKNYFVVGLSH